MQRAQPWPCPRNDGGTATSSGSAPVAPRTDTAIFNGAYVQKKEAAIKCILEHPLFSGIVDAEALAIDGRAELFGS